MYGILFGILVLLIGFTSTVGRWTIEYFRDPKALRRFPNFSAFSGITNIPYMILPYKNFRSKGIHELHAKGSPIIRTGPNSLSFSDMRAIKDIYGHSTKCTKDDQYIIQSGTYVHLADVVGKKEHAHKRKVLSSAFALKNLEEWEFRWPIRPRG